MNKAQIFLVETLALQIGFRLPSNLFSTMYLYWEQTVTKNYHDIKYSLYVADVSFRDFINSLEMLEVPKQIFLILNSKRNYLNLNIKGNLVYLIASKTLKFL
jgi:hypothetical protein